MTSSSGGVATTARWPRTSYDRVAFFYDEIASVYSLGAIDRAKRAHLEWLAPNERVLYVGVGRGREAALAVERCALVVGLDLAPAMLARFGRRVRQRKGAVEILAGDLFDPEILAGETFDAVVAHFFLNVFDPAGVEQALGRMIDWLAPSGRLHLADFAAWPMGSRADRLAHAYYGPVLWAAHGLGLAAHHRIYDYVPTAERLGLQLKSRERFGLLGAYLPAYEALTFARAAEPESRASTWDGSAGSGRVEGADFPPPRRPARR